MKTDVFSIFIKDGNKASDRTAGLAIYDSSVLKQVIDGAASENKRIKNASAKCLRTISELAPHKLYPHFNLFAKLLDGEDNILKWNAIYILGNLTVVDDENKFDAAMLKKYFNLFYDKSIVTAANTFRILGTVALYKPGFRKKITNKLINACLPDRQVETLPFSSECRNILAGTAIEAFEMFIDDIKDNKNACLPIDKFAQKHLKNRRSGTRKKAERYLKNHV